MNAFTRMTRIPANEVRERVLLDHDALREVLTRVEDLATQVASGEPLADALRSEGRALHETLCDHVDWEDENLAPVLRAAGPRGEERADQLAREHREQRELLDYTLERLRDESRPAVVLARDLLGLVTLLREDMVDEERDMLDERVLCNTPMHSEVEGR
jgi:hemerythrin-like domain-containing protein